MGRTPKDVTEAELGVLRRLWEDGERTVRELTDALYPEGRTSDAATVQKLLERLDAKGFVRRSRTRPYRFTACIERDELIERRLLDTANALCDGSLSPLLTRLVDRPLSEEDRAVLLDLIDKLDLHPGRRTGRRGGKS